MPVGHPNGTERPNLTAHGYVLQRMRQAILDGELPSGSRLIQAELAQQFDVSITPVREALRDLAGEGLVVFDPHRGSRVRSFDLGEVQEIYQIRMALEPLMVSRMIGQVDADRLDEAARLIRKMERTKDINVWSDLNRRFHACFAEEGRTSRLATILSGLRDSASVYVGLSLRASPERRAESDREHTQILEAYRRGDTEAATRLAVQHMRTTLVTIEEAHERGLL
ncbi:DNA-binding transcriptional regulator, GntR family [Microlunatus sagamiharensis]|jgi:DNA-binding GntR family transcriptional regulator|uniref:DNA-binding transcriptional regulator, GntR family n=1 Tax=Microlunatus sagamiharensis TaxID=546874 RepID=A0A1H2MB96_9ACTN|nr:DNA-binding transcriptional regulator, GntR family [Microlunatus sagamiharensis]